MAVIIDPDDLSQGAILAVASAVFAIGTGADIRIHTSAGNLLPALAANEFFEVRDHSDPNNNGLFQVITVTTSTDNYECNKISAGTPVVAGSEAIRVLGATGVSTEKSIHIDTASSHIYILEQGNVSVDGVLAQTKYSFIKEEWKDDPDLIAYSFPMISVTSEQFEYIFDWEPKDVVSPLIQTRKLIRTGGWSEIDTNDGSKLKKQYFGAITLGSFEDEVTDLAYYQVGDDPTDTAAAIDFTFAGPVNEAVLTYDENVPADAGTGFAITLSNTITRNDGGNWASDGYVVGAQVTILGAEDAGNIGTFVLTSVANAVDGAIVVSGTPLTNNAADTTARFATDYRNSINLFLRIRDGDTNGKTFAQADFVSAGLTVLTNKVEKFPLSNATDLKILETDANVSTISPYTEIFMRYLPLAYNREVDSATKRDFGIVVDVGTYSQSNGASATSTLFSSAAIGDITLGDYTGGVLTIHEGSDQGNHTISGTPVNNAGTLEVTLTVALTATASNLSFTLQRASPVSATAEEIYEKVQYLLRQAADIDGTSAVVTGKTADAALSFVGSDLKTGLAIPANPNGGGSGVFIEGFDSNDTNRIAFLDNIAVSRTFPFVAAGTINFNTNLVADTGPAEYTMFFEYTERFTNTGFGLSAVSGSSATLDSSTTDLTAELANGDHIRLTGFADPADNGIWRLTGAPAGAGPWTAAVTKVNGDTAVLEAAGSSISLDKNPIDSPDALIVDNNAGVDIAASVPGASASFDFDYDGNVQGGRTAGTDANIQIRAIGLDVAQSVETTGAITRATGLSFSLVASLERNYDNP